MKRMWKVNGQTWEDRDKYILYEAFKSSSLSRSPGVFTCILFFFLVRVLYAVFFFHECHHVPSTLTNTYNGTEEEEAKIMES